MALRQCGRDGLFCDGEPGRGATGVSVGDSGSGNNMRIKDLCKPAMEGNRQFRRLPLALLAFGAIVLASCFGGDTPPAETGTAQDVVLSYKITANGDLTAGVPVRLESLNLSRLGELRLREGLDGVVVGADSEFTHLLYLKDWVAAQWPAGNPDPYPPWDAITVLDWIRDGLTGGFCAQYAQVLLQSAASFGMQARYVEIGSIDNPYAHFVMEVWSNQFDKWVVLDADYNLHFESAGVPLSALEVHDALVRGEIAEVEVISGTRREGHSDPGRWPLQTAELYYYLRVHLKANHVAVPEEIAFDRYNDMVEWLDELTVPWEFSQVASPYPKERLTNLQTDRRQDLEARFNQVEVSIDSNEGGVLSVGLQNNVHAFDRYEYRMLRRLGEDRAWLTSPAAVISWRPSRRSRILEVRGVNSAGVPGPASRVSVVLGAEDR
jgi:hypothetical protein